MFNDTSWGGLRVLRVSSLHNCVTLEGSFVAARLNECVWTLALQDSEAASCKMNSLGSNHSIPSTSVSTGSQSSSVNSMQEVLDDSCSDMTMMHPQDYSSTLDSSPHTKKVKVRGERASTPSQSRYGNWKSEFTEIPRHISHMFISVYFNTGVIILFWLHIYK